jgi:hypothetical protein
MHRIVLNIAAPRGFGGGGRRAPAPPPPIDACLPAGTTAPRTEDNPQRRGRGPTGLQPGEYMLKRTVDGQTYTQPVTLKADPRDLPGGADALPEGEEDNL